MRCFRRKNLPVYVPVQPVRPTFVVTKSGIVARIVSFVLEMRKPSPRSWLVTEEGQALSLGPECETFVSPLSREHYNHLIALGDSHWGNFTRLYFEQRCEQLGVVVESDGNLNGTDAAENK